MAKGTLRNNLLEISILPRPIVIPDFNTGEKSPATERAITEARETNLIVSRQLEQEENIMEVEYADELESSRDVEFREAGEESSLTVIVAQEGYEIQDNLLAGTDPSKYFSFSSSLKHYYGGKEHTASARKEPNVVLPLASGGLVIGNSVLVHAQKPQVEGYVAELKRSKCVVVIVGEEMQNSLIDKCQDKINAVFIVIPKGQDETLNINRLMDNMCINAVTAMAGPCSVVVALVRGRYYYYRGVNWPGFVEGASTAKMSRKNS